MEYTPRRKLTREFKREAVRQVALSEKPKAQLARELGVRVGQLRTWRLEFEKEAVTGIAKPDRSAAENLEQLRRENAGTIVWRNAPALPVHGPTINHIPFRDSRGGRLRSVNHPDS